MYVDTHCHVLPGIDDGAKDDEMALNMLRIAALNGTGHIVATPHYIYGNTGYDFSLIADKCNKLNKVVLNEGIDLTIHPGCEVFLSPELPDLYEKGVINTLAGSVYMLIELPMMTIPIYTEDILYTLQLKGVVPIIAHPERYIEFQKKPDILKSMVQRGILAQVNSGSLTGLYGKETQKVALKFLKMDIIHFIASDAHTDRGRSPDLKKAVDIVEQKYGRDMTEELFIRNGMKILKNENIKI